AIAGCPDASYCCLATTRVRHFLPGRNHDQAPHPRVGARSCATSSEVVSDAHISARRSHAVWARPRPQRRPAAGTSLIEIGPSFERLHPTLSSHVCGSATV